MAAAQASRSAYDVFLSFPGDDTCDVFTNCLYHALTQHNINVFMDGKNVGKGEEIDDALSAIEGSKIAIIVFSERYAFSTWHLDELLKILNCEKRKGLLVIPVFYKVDPATIRKQRGPYEEAMANHEKRFENDLEKVQLWRSALCNAASILGWDTDDYKFEGILVKEIAKDVSEKLKTLAAAQIYWVTNYNEVGKEKRVSDVKGEGSSYVSRGKTKAKGDDYNVGIYGKKPVFEEGSTVYNDCRRSHRASFGAVPFSGIHEEKLRSNRYQWSISRPASFDEVDVPGGAPKSVDDELEHIIKGVIKVYRQMNGHMLYDVFLNFRGDDTRYGFTGSLYNALLKERIRAFMDNEGLEMGDHISKVFQVIEQSRMSILVFSETYATSEWCLHELVKILDCMDSRGQVVLPIFYKVTPSMVRNQTGSYGKAMVDHEIPYRDQMDKVYEWRSALKEASYIRGRQLMEGGYEYKLIEEIIAIVSQRKKEGPLCISVEKVLWLHERSLQWPAKSFNVSLMKPL